MPTVRVTVANNAKQTQRTVLLLPSSASPNPSVSSSYRGLILNAAKAKFQSKKANRVFNANGKELMTSEDWQQAVKNDAVIFVSKQDEDYVGTTSSTSSDPNQSQLGNAENDCSITQLNHKAEVDSLSLTQLETTARTIPGIVHAVAQPDLHLGTKYPIGGVFVSRGWIHPPLIGSDIGCGMAWYRTTLTSNHVNGDKGRKVAEKLRGLEGTWRSQQQREFWLRDGADNSSAGAQWDASLGTIGAGNHFAELQVVEESRQEAGELMRENNVVLLVHSGSRGYGSDILKRYTQHGRNSMKDSDAQAYLTEHDRACRWASKNRDLIALRFLSLLEPGNDVWSLGSNGSRHEASCEEVQQARTYVQERKVVDIWHNNIEPAWWPPHDGSQISELELFRVYIHRKGAAPTFNPETRQPLTVLPLPGSRATPTLILHPTLTTANEYGRSNALSVAHGAGRARSRADAARYVAEKYKGRIEDLIRGDFVRADRQGNKKHDEQNGRNVHGGTWVVCEDKQLIWEEAGEAYKDVWDVGDDLVAHGCAEIWGWCRGRISYKVRHE